MSTEADRFMSSGSSSEDDDRATQNHLGLPAKPRSVFVGGESNSRGLYATVDDQTPFSFIMVLCPSHSRAMASKVAPPSCKLEKAEMVSLEKGVELLTLTDEELAEDRRPTGVVHELHCPANDEKGKMVGDLVLFPPTITFHRIPRHDLNNSIVLWRPN